MNHRRKPAQLREHIATFFIFIRRLQAKYRKVTWFAENVACPESGVRRSNEGRAGYRNGGALLRFCVVIGAEDQVRDGPL